MVRSTAVHTGSSFIRDLVLYPTCHPADLPTCSTEDPTMANHKRKSRPATVSTTRNRDLRKMLLPASTQPAAFLATSSTPRATKLAAGTRTRLRRVSTPSTPSTATHAQQQPPLPPPPSSSLSQQEPTLTVPSSQSNPSQFENETDLPDRPSPFKNGADLPTFLRNSRTRETSLVFLHRSRMTQIF